MSTLASVLSQPVVSTQGLTYTTQQIVSSATAGEVAPSDVQQEWIDWAQDEIESRTGLAFQSENFTDEIDGNGLDTIFTKGFPVLEIFDVQVNGQTLDPAAYVVNPRTGSIRLKKPVSGYMARARGYWGPVFHPGVANVLVSGIRGYRRVPPLVQKIATLLVAKLALGAKQGLLVDRETIGNFSQIRSFKKLDDELDRAWEALGRSFPVDFT